MDSPGVSGDPEARSADDARGPLESHVRAEDLWSDTLRHLVDADSQTIDHEIDRALVRAGRFAGADRCYVFEYAADRASLCMTHEWSAPGSLSQSDAIGQIDESVLPGFVQRLKNGDEVYVPDVSRLGSDARIERVVLTAHGVESTVLVPMVHRGVFLGFVGFDATARVRYWTQAHRATLRFVADLFAGALGRTRIERRNAVLGRALEHSPAGVAIFAVDGTVEWVNPAFERVSGHERGELTERSSHTRPFGLKSAEDLNAMLATVLAGRTWQHDMELPNAAGAPVRFRLKMFAVDAGDAESGRIVALVDDFTLEPAGEAEPGTGTAGTSNARTAIGGASTAPAKAPAQLSLEDIDSFSDSPTGTRDATQAAVADVGSTRATADGGSPSIAGGSDERRLRILVADASDASVRVAKAFLSSLAERIDGARNGLEALDLVRTGSYDLVMMDMQLPGMDGYAATEAIRALPDPVASDTPIVALTSYALAEEIGRAIAAGCDGYITKPIRRADLSRCVERYARTRLR